jgi:hypothetical protein
MALLFLMAASTLSGCDASKNGPLKEEKRSEQANPMPIPPIPISPNKHSVPGKNPPMPALPCNASEWTALFNVNHDGWFSTIWALDLTHIFVAGKFKNVSVNNSSKERSPPYEYPIFHLDGTHWTKHQTEAVSVIWDINGTTEQDVYAVGGFNTIQHWDGKKLEDRIY